MTKKGKELRGLYLRGEIWWLSYQKDGKRHFISLETKEISEAIKKAAEVKKLPILNQGATLTDESKRWIQWSIERRGITEKSQHNCRLIVKRLAQVVGDISPAQVSFEMAQRFFDKIQKDTSHTTARTYYTYLLSFFRWCVEDARIATSNPFAQLKLPRFTPPARKSFVEKELRDKLCKNAIQHRKDVSFMLFAGFHAGMRRNEIQNARPEWFDLKRRLVTIRKITTKMADSMGLDAFDIKDREERSIPLSDKFLNFLKNYPMDQDYMLAPGVRRGRSLYRYDIKRPFNEYMASQKCEWITIHDMRRTFASLLASSGKVSIHEIAKWIGDDIRTTEKHYAHLVPDLGRFQAAIQ